MGQFNLNISEAFEKDIATYMKFKNIKFKSQAIREAISECLEKYRNPQLADFKSWLGAGNKAKRNPKPRFKNRGQLWKF
jgi:hypothetical protein